MATIESKAKGRVIIVMIALKLERGRCMAFVGA